MRVYAILEELEDIRDLPDHANMTIWDKNKTIIGVFSHYDSAQKFIDENLEIDDFTHYFIHDYEVKE